nr:MAG TPA: hypothetical protein [Caudoviricetes sp.]
MICRDKKSRVRIGHGFPLGSLRAEYRQFPGSLAVRIFCII